LKSSRALRGSFAAKSCQDYGDRLRWLRWQCILLSDYGDRLRSQCIRLSRNSNV